jgi:hypothetical protein
MFDEKKVHQLGRAFERVFAFNVTRSTFRQLQNVIFAIAEGNKETATAILDSLLSGEIKSDANKALSSPEFRKLVDNYSTLSQVAKDVLERGEFINLVTSDILQNPQAVVFANRIRRIDGEELQFITDAESTLQLVNHFLNRIQEVDRNEPARNIVDNLRTDLSAIRDKIDDLLASKKPS